MRVVNTGGAKTMVVCVTRGVEGSDIKHNGVEGKKN